MTDGWSTDRRGLLGSAGLAMAMPLSSASQAGAVRPGGTLSLDTTQEAAREPIDDGAEFVVTRGFRRAGDGGGATWRKTAAPTVPSPLRSRSGAAFEIADAVIRPEMLGAEGGDADDQAALQAAVTLATRTARQLRLAGPRYSHSGEIVIEGGLHRFSIVGADTTDLVQLRSGAAHFVFAGENTSHWAIRGFRFMWARDQRAEDRGAYAVRFESDNSAGGVAGHYNFEIADCILWNGFRGFGQRDDGQRRPHCPVWGGVFRRISALSLTSGAAIFLRTWGRAGQPNNRIESFYARCDRMREPAIVLEACDSTVLSNIEFNKGVGCRLSVTSAPNTHVTAIRFEHVTLECADDRLIVAAGRSTTLDLTGVSVQSLLLPGDAADRAIVVASDGADVMLERFVDVPWRSPMAGRQAGASTIVAVARTASDGRITIGRMSTITDPALRVTGPRGDGGVRVDGT